MKKSLIATIAAAALLAVSCSNQGGGSKPKQKTVPMPVEELVEFYDYYHDFEFDPDLLPEYPSSNEDAVITYDESYASWFGTTDIYVENTTSVECGLYVTYMLEAGWELVKVEEDGEDLNYYLQAPEFAQGNDMPTVTIYDWLASSDYVDLYFGVTMAEHKSFPSEVIAETLSGYGATDELPAFTGEASSYFWSEDYVQLMAVVEEGKEAEAVAQYVQDLLAADYVEAGEDEYGDMHYLSPNGELDVCPWDGSVYDDPGFMVIDIVVNKTITTLSTMLENLFGQIATGVEFTIFESYDSASAIFEVVYGQEGEFGDVVEVVDALAYIGYAYTPWLYNLAPATLAQDDDGNPMGYASQYAGYYTVNYYVFETEDTATAGVYGVMITIVPTTAYEITMAMNCATEYQFDYYAEYDASDVYFELKTEASLLDVTTEVAKNIPGFFSKLVAPELTEDDYGDPMGYASFTFAGYKLQIMVSIPEGSEGVVAVYMSIMPILQ